MYSKTSFAVLAAVLVAAPLSAQIRPRTTDTGRRTPDGSVIRSDGTIIRRDGTIIRPDGSVIRTSDGSVSRGSSRVPRGQLPPKGMCRVWIDGVPPGQQPPVTDCATAERNRVPGSRVIYGDRESFPGKGKGKFKNRSTQQCAYRDAVVVGGRVVDVCRDANGNIITDPTRGGKVRGHEHEDDDDDRYDNERDDDDRYEDRSGRGHGHSAVGSSDREWSKAAKKQGKGNRGRRGRDN